MLPRFFIYHPIFASVIALAILIFGSFALSKMAIERYPNIAPPTVSVGANYRGASAQTVEESVTQVLEQQIKGLEGLLYYTSKSEANGRSRIDLHFELGTDIDQAQIRVQNTMNAVLNKLPEPVQRQGLNIWKTTGDLLLIVGLYDSKGLANNIDLSDYMINYFQQPLNQITGVGEVDIFGSSYAMRIWLNPHQLRNYALVASDIEQALTDANTQIAAGAIGSMPNLAEQRIFAKVSAGSQLKTVADFENVILKADADGRVVRLKDVARVEMGAENYTTINTLNGYPSAGLGIYLTPDANAISTSKQIKATIEQLKPYLPEGYQVIYPRDNTPFIEESIQQVIMTLIEAIILVVAVMYLFLQNWRATLIPTMTIPIVIAGTALLLYLMGISINTLTLFALVLAIGLLVDDTIVVVENVERLMHEQGLEVKQACLASMQEMSGALIGITLVLSAVFIPMAFFTGSTGVIYRQFSITLVTAMLLSLCVAMFITPALCTLLLKPSSTPRWAVYVEYGLNHMRDYATRIAQWMLAYRVWMLTSIVLLSLGLVLLYRDLPTSFIPNEDQGLLALQYRLHESATLGETQAIGQEINQYLLSQQAVESVLLINGQNFSGSGTHLGMAFVSLKHWDQRSSKADAAAALRQRFMQDLQSVNAKVMVSLPASVSGLGQSNALEFWLRDVHGQGRQALLEKLHALQQQKAVHYQDLASVAPEHKAEVFIDIDQNKAKILGIAQRDIQNTLASAWGSRYIGDFIERGRIKPIILQGDAPYRADPQYLGDWYVRNHQGQMLSLAQFATPMWTGGAESLHRFMGLSAVPMEAFVQSHASSGQAMQEIRTHSQQYSGIDLAWSGLSLQEQHAQHQALFLYLISILFIFMCLAALYESIKIPLVILLGLPLGVMGSIIFATLFKLPNDVYFQIALLTGIGLSCKNAILIVEFATKALSLGKSSRQAALTALQLRLRPILMTSLAFGAGIVPLIFATGAGAVSRHEIGLSILGSVLFGTLYVPLFTVLLFVVIYELSFTRRFARLKGAKKSRLSKLIS